MNVAIYLRAGIDKKVSDKQLNLLIEKANLSGRDYRIFTEIFDPNGGQPCKEELLIRIRKNEFDTVQVYKLGDWSYSLSGQSMELNELGSKGIRFISYFENFDSSTPTGKLYLKILSAFAGFEQSLISEPVKMASGRETPACQKNKESISTTSDPVKKVTRITGLMNNNKTDYDLIDMNSACLLTGYSKHSLYSMTCRREIPFVKRPGGRKIFFSKRAILEWITFGKS